MPISGTALSTTTLPAANVLYCIIIGFILVLNFGLVFLYKLKKKYALMFWFVYLIWSIKNGLSLSVAYGPGYPLIRLQALITELH
jgi:hypothetical protein